MEKVIKKETKDDKIKNQKLEEQASGKRVESEKTNRNLKSQEKMLETILREKENLQREYNKSILMRDKLEQVCREQQKIIKSMKNESLAKLRVEEELRKESQIKFQASLNEINQSLSKNNEENLKLRDHNIEMTKKLKFLAEQYQTREEHLGKLNEQIQLESQLQQAKLNKVQAEAAIEKEILIKEKQIALENLAQTRKVIQDLSDRERELKDQLNLYTSKYDDFQKSIQKSNNLFSGYKTELEKLSKDNRRLEKENAEWKRKWEKSNATLIQLATEKQERDEHAARCTKQVEKLQNILRVLQLERTNLYKLLRENEIECPPVPSLPPEPEPMELTPATKEINDKNKMEQMTKNCAEIKQTLASLQSQIKTLKAQENEACSLLKLGNPISISQQQEDALKRQHANKKKKQKSKNNKNKESNTSVNSPKESSAAAPAENIKEKQEQVEELENADSKEADQAEVAAIVNTIEDQTNIVDPKNAATNQGEEAAIVTTLEDQTNIGDSDSAEVASCYENLPAITPESVKIAKLLADALHESPPSPSSTEAVAQY